MDKLLQQDLFLSFYGDDFTGSTDTMESLALNGVRTALFLAPPTETEVLSFRLKQTWGQSEERNLQAFGVAGISRSLRKEEMKNELVPIFQRLSKIPTDFFHYKICSTFDSSPEIGSIGYATELAEQYFPSSYVPLIVGAPFLNRFSVFGNLFARIDGVTFRLDRHPTMSRHPVTPMHESDLRLHLAHQTDRQVKLMDVFALEGAYGTTQQYFESLKLNQGDILLFDTLTMDHLLRVGDHIFHNVNGKTCQLIIGSSGVEYALCFHLHKTGRLEKPESPVGPGKAEQIVAMSGSAAPTTGKQIDRAIDNGFADIRIDTRAIVNPETTSDEIARVTAVALQELSHDKSLMIYSANGPDDPIIEETKQLLARLNLEADSVSLQLGNAQGKILMDILRKAGKLRSIVCGGDTSGHVSRALGIYALETRMPIAPGAPLCIAHSRDPLFDGLEISLKGGQNGSYDYIESIKEGRNIES